MSPNKRAVSALRVVKELPAHMALGPHGEAVAALIERAEAIAPEDAKRLAAAWADAAAAAAWEAAAAAGAAAAAWALVVRDLTTPEQFDILYGPWASVMETA